MSELGGKAENERLLNVHQYSDNETKIKVAEAEAKARTSEAEARTAEARTAEAKARTAEADILEREKYRAILNDKSSSPTDKAIARQVLKIPDFWADFFYSLGCISFSFILNEHLFQHINLKFCSCLIAPYNGYLSSVQTHSKAGLMTIVQLSRRESDSHFYLNQYDALCTSPQASCTCTAGVELQACKKD